MNDAVDGLSALAQETRLAVFRLLVSTGPDGLAAGEIARRIGTPANTMSVHLSILVQAGLVASRREGRSVIYGPDLEGARRLIGFLVADCCGGRPEICAPVIESLANPCCSEETRQ